MRVLVLDQENADERLAALTGDGVETVRCHDDASVVCVGLDGDAVCPLKEQPVDVAVVTWGERVTEPGLVCAVQKGVPIAILPEHGEAGPGPGWSTAVLDPSEDLVEQLRRASTMAPADQVRAIDRAVHVTAERLGVTLADDAVHVSTQRDNEFVTITVDPSTSTADRNALAVAANSALVALDRRPSTIDIAITTAPGTP